MKRLFITFSLALTALVLSAMPAKRGQWQTLTLADGTEVRAQLVGDEHLHYWLTEDGRQFTIRPDGKAAKADMEKMRLNASRRRAGNTLSKRLRSPRRTSIGDRTHYTGQKKGIVILMQFNNSKFKTANNRNKYNDILNKENYSTGSFQGSVADYFKAQSGGQFELAFDVVGPFTAKKESSYYGSNDSDGYDMHPDELLVEGLKAADDEVDFRDYDWDGDGEVDQVFMVYAGKGEASGGSTNTIWPHMYWLSKTGKQLTLDGVLVDTYACANEIGQDGSIDGIGAFCHEFSHCLGYPDFYDTSYGGWFGMNQFDLMDQGSYNGNSFCPAGYTAYEKWMAGWIEPIVLGEANDTVTSLVATSEHGEAYIMYNDAHKDEFYMIENRQKTNWDAALPGKGLMITHVDFDKAIWEQNTPNTKVTQVDVRQSNGDLTKTNDHQRCTIFHADNKENEISLATDLYPYNKNDSLTAASKPAASLFNINSLGNKTMQGAILKITQNSDRTMSFIYRAGEKSDTTQVTPIDPSQPVVAHGDTLFYESFDKCAGTGANDGNWGTTIAGSSSKFATDNAGWDYIAAYAGYQCARFGNSTKLGETTTPAFSIDGEATLSFRATAWNTDGTLLKLSVVQNPDSAAITIEPQQFNMDSFSWKDFTVTLNGKGTMKLTFTPEKRFLLDEVLVLKNQENDSTTVIRGDVNLDGTVDVADIAAIIDIMAGATVPGASASGNADVNGDGTVDVADIATVIDIMAGKEVEEDEEP